MLETPPASIVRHRRSSSWLAPALALALALVGCAGDQTATSLSHTRSAVSANPAVVISQLYGGGGNASAPFQNDFIELFNRTSSPVPVDGWSVQYASATGTGLFSANVTLLSGTIAPGHYYLVRGAGGATGAALPASDASGAINMSATGGKVVLVSSQSGLACNGGPTACSASDSALIVDLVGFGSTSTFFEGAGPTGTLTNTTAALRAAAGWTDTNNNATDFTVGAPDFTFAFTISGTAPTPIHTVQGAAHLSPLAGQVLNVGPFHVRVEERA